MPTDVFLTGSYGKCGTAVIDHLEGEEAYDFTYFNRSDRDDDHPYGGYDTVLGDVADRDRLVETSAGHDSFLHFAGYTDPESGWEDVFEPNLLGTYNALEAARENEIEEFVFASTNHVMGGYEGEHAPALYEPGYGFVLDNSEPVRPDSVYGASKAWGEALLRYYVDYHDYPKRGYVLRICSMQWPRYDHPYGDAEQGVDNGDWERGSPEYERAVARMSSMWHSRRDFAHQLRCVLDDDSVEFGVFSGVSDNRSRWFGLESARSELGYRPRDDAAEWTA